VIESIGVIFVQRCEQIAYCIFFIILKGDYLFLENVLSAVTVKQSVENTKQPVVLPLAPLHKAAIVAYA